MSRTKNITLWVIAIIVMTAFAIYQRKTGPTYPIHDEVNINGTKVKYELIRSFGGPGDAPIEIEAPNNIVGKITWRRYKSHDNWVTNDMTRSGSKLVFNLPHQPPAGKIQYVVELGDGTSFQKITKNDVKIRFKGEVPDFVLYPHIVAMFMSFFFAGRAALEGLYNGDRTYKYTMWTMAIFLFGGTILGPAVQYYAFGAFWTGWPIADGSSINLFKFGDLTDNKTLVAIIGWIIAWWQIRKHPDNKKWAIFGFAVMAIVYLIPHSLLGSEIDHTKIPQ